MGLIFAKLWSLFGGHEGESNRPDHYLSALWSTSVYSLSPQNIKSSWWAWTMLERRRFYTSTWWTKLSRRRPRSDRTSRRWSLGISTFWFGIWEDSRVYDPPGALIIQIPRWVTVVGRDSWGSPQCADKELSACNRSLLSCTCSLSSWSLIRRTGSDWRPQERSSTRCCNTKTYQRPACEWNGRGVELSLSRTNYFLFPSIPDV